MDYSTYYTSIAKPFFAPPEWVFGLAWGIIYPLIVIAGVYLLYLVFKRIVPTSLLLVFGVNIVANLLFTPIQLTLQNNLLATIDILVVLGTLAYLQYKIFSLSKVIFILFLPYLLWGSFATILQVTIFFMN